MMISLWYRITEVNGKLGFIVLQVVLMELVILNIIFAGCIHHLFIWVVMMIKYNPLHYLHIQQRATRQRKHLTNEFQSRWILLCNGSCVWSYFLYHIYLNIRLCKFEAHKHRIQNKSYYRYVVSLVLLLPKCFIYIYFLEIYSSYPGQLRCCPIPRKDPF
jgi:hypothetical protein